MNTETMPGTGNKRKSFLSTDFAKIAITAILTAGIMLGYMYLRDADSGDDFVFIQNPEGFNSEIIDWENARKMIDYWAAHPGLKVKTADDNYGSKKALIAFRISAIQMDSIINKNQALNYNAGEKPKDVIIYFGLRDTIINRRQRKAVHLIALGVKGGNQDELLNYSKDKTQNPNIYDKADPCPPGKNCPPLKP